MKHYAHNLPCNDPFDSDFSEDNFGEENQAYTFPVPRDLAKIRAVSIGPDSDFDTCKLRAGGRLVTVSRERPFYGVIESKAQVQLIPVDPTKFISGTGDLYKVGVQLWNYDPPALSPRRNPKRFLQNQSISALTNYSRVCIRGRDETHVTVLNEDATNALTYTLNAVMYDPVGDTVDTIDITPAGAGSVAVNTFETVVLTTKYDAVFVAVTPAAGTISATVRVDAYDR